MRLLPLGVFLLCQNNFFGSFGVAATQCRLKSPGKVLANVPATPPSNPSNGVGTPQSSTVPPSSSIPPSFSSNPGSAAPTPSPAPDFVYGNDKIRGVNLGGWLVLEPWITPSVFESTNNDAIVDEYTLGQYLDTKTALDILQRHWETWITEEDFVAIKAAGLNHVRIPLGYWSVPLTSADTDGPTHVDPYIPGGWPYLVKALGWAKKHSIRVIIDIHGAPGSQNGYDNSGHRTSNPQWADNPANVSRTVDTLRFITKSIGDMVDVIELLNEPAGFRGGGFSQTVRQFWSDGYDAVREAGDAGIKVMIGDAFLGVQNWNGFLAYPRAQGVLMDFHEYQIFSDLELDRSFDEHVKFACNYWDSLSAYESSNIWTIIGEWSNAVTDCAKWLNGRGVGSRWDGTWYSSANSQYHGSCTNFTGSYAGFSGSYKAFLRKYWEVQVEVGENISGWVFWTWKAENADEWSYQKGLEGGWIPHDPTDRKYPGICS
ncbi:Glucan 1,3-beta-glucosidase [Hypsizygus marmoreus]|uniref:Glucan 1,3-beta-glucosidase n=1 Tax=Hypsizygus marmoreus TaxID=39966 RepID=A0A369JWQ1_HYPMA|nr:Glucan 1,3-beta-glucosidase [Hypsizygus marmoreus]